MYLTPGLVRKGFMTMVGLGFIVRIRAWVRVRVRSTNQTDWGDWLHRGLELTKADHLRLPRDPKPSRLQGKMRLG